MPAACFTIC